MVDEKKTKELIVMSSICLFYLLSIIVHILFAIPSGYNFSIDLLVVISLLVLLIAIITKRYLWGWFVIIGASVFYIFCYGYSILVGFDLMPPIEQPFLHDLLLRLFLPMYLCTIIPILPLARLAIVTPIAIQIAILVYISANKSYFNK